MSANSADYKPMIAILPQWEHEIKAFACRDRYVALLNAAGASAFIVTYDFEDIEGDSYREFLDICDGVLLPGGGDIHPSVYGAEDQGSTGPYLPDRDALEMRIVREVIARDMPLFGICRGTQMINIALGGELAQDLPPVSAHNLQHWQEEPYARTSHDVQIVPGSILASALGQETIAVNSMHHQACAGLAPELICSARAEDGVIEAIERPESSFCVAVQWHPEYIKEDPASKALACAFIDACKRYHETKHN